MAYAQATNGHLVVNRPAVGQACIPCRAKGHFCNAVCYEEDSGSPLCAECRDGFDCSYVLTQESKREDRARAATLGVRPGSYQYKAPFKPADKEGDVVDTSKPLTSKEIAERGIKTSKDFVDFMAGIMADLVAGRIEPKVAQAACQAAQTMLQAVRMQREFSENPHESIRFSLPPPERSR